MKKPPDIELNEVNDYKKIIIKNFDDNLLTFQIILILTPFILIELFLVVPNTPLSIAIFIILTCLIIYWIISNILSRYEITISQTEISFTSGCPFPSTKTII